MLISVIVPVFNRPRAVERALRSALSQSGIEPTSLEILLIDDCSCPPLELTISDVRVKIIRLSRNSGAASARNAGIKAARGEYIAFLDSDDVWLDDKLQSQVTEIKKTNLDRSSWLHAHVCSFYYPARVTKQLELRVPRPARRLIEFVSGCWFCPGSTLFIKRAAFDRVGLFDERLRRLEDLDWFMRFGWLGGRLHVTPKPGAIIAPSSSAGTSEMINRAIEQLEEKYSRHEDIVFSVPEITRLRSYLELERAVSCLRDDRYLKAVVHGIKSVWLAPRCKIGVIPYWQRSDDVPASVVDYFRAMTTSPPG